MPNSIALTRIHTPEDYWNRMALAEQILIDYARRHWSTYHHKNETRCLDMAMQLADRYHEHWTINRKEYFG